MYSKQLFYKSISIQNQNPVPIYQITGDDRSDVELKFWAVLHKIAKTTNLHDLITTHSETPYLDGTTTKIDAMLNSKQEVVEKDDE